MDGWGCSDEGKGNEITPFVTEQTELLLGMMDNDVLWEWQEYKHNIPTETH